ncbi:MAG TPA: helix-turn-helix domain-containing protein [Burkholderiales bacterium]|nr:helix-turn-helix domain-containing protein [Burkholderiales bacterium]HEX2650141.1 helix-turn-helix domain-containing protein [Burkholderiales bacterium]
MKPAAQHLAAPKKFTASCASCNFRELCIPAGICADDLARVENLVYARRRVKRGEALFNAGDEFKALYAVRSGFFKSSIADGEGREQVTGFFMGGELLGMEGIGTGRYHGAAIALEDSEVCVLPYALIESLAREVPGLQRQLNAVMAREIVRDHGVMMLLGSMRAEERLAAFLLNLSKRFTARGYSKSEFTLRMKREEIGSYLGLKLETVSRLFSAFDKEGLVEVEQKHLRIRDIAGLERILAAKS